VDGIALSNDLRNIAAICREVGMVFQQINLFPHLTVLDNLCLAPVVVRRRNRAAVDLHGTAHLLFDEPTCALDPEMVREVLDVMRNLAEDDITMVVVTHEVKFAEQVADTVVLMADGEVVEEAPPDRFFKAPAHERTRRFLDQTL
jgi:general L-amino acid transport system ATP-binding protein